MREQRQVSPIPPGRYWIEVLGPENQRDFATWVREMEGAVRIETVELDSEATPTVEFVIFTVPEGRKPFLNAVQFGFPTFADPNVTSRQDVEQTPPPQPGAAEQIQSALDRAGASLASAGKIVFVVLLVALVAELAPRGRARRRAAA